MTKFKSLMKSRWVIWILLIVVPFFAYLPVFNGYFQQDEWMAFAFNYVSGSEGIVGVSFSPSVGHYQPFNTLLIYALFSIFGISYLPYAFISVFLHLTSVLLVFVVARLIFKDIKIAFASAILFSVLAPIYQATSWVMADIGTHISTIFALISIIYFTFFLKTRRNVFVLLCLVSFFVSLLFKETAIGMFVVYPIFYFLFRDKQARIDRRIIFSFLLSGGIYFLIRFGMLFFTTSYTNNTVATSTQSLPLIFYNILSMPVKTFSQIIIPSNTLFEISKFVTLPISKIVGLTPGTTQFDAFAQKRVMEILSYVIFLVFMYIGFKVFRKSKNVFEKKLAVGLVLFAFFNSFIFGLAPERVGIITDIDSRNLYFISIGVIFYLILILRTIFTGRYKIVYGIFAILFLVNVLGLGQRLNSFVNESNVRKKIITQIKRDNPILPSKVIFYTESDKSFYGLPESEKILPFQSGFGQTLLVLYYQSSGYSKEIFTNRFLWEITEDGYKEVNGKGFGYFRDFEKLKSVVDENELLFESVISYRYFSETDSLVNVTEETREKLRR